MAKVEVGSVVGAGRWPYAGGHVDCWGRPHVGILLADTDPRAWEGTLAFPFRRPSAEEARAWVDGVKARGWWSGNSVPVLWLWADGTFRVWWESVKDDRWGVKPYAEDLAAWEAARAESVAQAAEARLRWGARSIVREAHRRRRVRGQWRSGRLAA